MKSNAASLLAGLSLLVCAWATPALPATELSYPELIEEEIKSLQAAGADQSTDPVFLTRLSDLYLDAGDYVYKKKDKRIQAYEEGTRLAERVLEVQEPNAQAHYLYAANFGSAARLKGMMASALTVMTLRKHTRRTLELAPDHPGALHMMGMLLGNLPTLQGGDSDESLTYLQRAVRVDPTYTHARLDLARAYLERDDIPNARKELHAVIESQHPRNQYAWAMIHKPEAEKLLQSSLSAAPRPAQPD